MEYVFAIGLGIASFLCFILGYREGLRIGMRTAKGIEPEKIKTPMQVVTEKMRDKTTEQEAKKEAQIWENIETNDGYTPEERALINKKVN